eukprot:g7361.t1
MDYSVSSQTSLSSTQCKNSGKIKSKAAREKARRDRLKERFISLANLINPDDPKCDKASILVDAIGTIKSLKQENEQLKKMNKFLEEKVDTNEKEKSYSQFQQGLIIGSNNNNNTRAGATPFDRGLEWCSLCRDFCSTGGMGDGGPSLDFSESVISEIANPIKGSTEKQDTDLQGQELCPEWSVMESTTNDPLDSTNAA